MGIKKEVKKKRLSAKDLSKLDNDDVPILPLIRAKKAFEAGDYKEADENWNFVKHGKRTKE